MNQGWVQAILYYVVALGAGGLGLALFQRITRFDDWKEIGHGNVAAALSSGGQVLGLAYIIHSAIISNQTLLNTLLWIGIGWVLQVIGYVLFDMLTPFRNDQAIANGNVAVGTLVAMIMVGLALVVGAVIQ